LPAVALAKVGGKANLMLRDLMVSKVRVKLLQTFLAQPDELFYVRQLVRATGEEINAVRRELLHMEKAGMVKKEARGNRLYYWFNKNHPLYGDLLSLVSKTVGLGAKILEKKAKIGKIKFALFSGRFVRGLPTREGGVDLLVVGKILMSELAKVVAAEEKEISREINYSVMTREEFEFRKKRRDPFLLGILGGSRVMLIGDEEDLVS
jgi:hypothetical protein